MTENNESFNPFVIVGLEYAAMARDVASATNWSDRLGYVVRGLERARMRRAALEQLVDGRPKPASALTTPLTVR